jgi:hypothetical protein
VWFVIIGVAIALLLGMLVLVIFEALVPSETMPGPLYLIRGLRKRARRIRRYAGCRADWIGSAAHSSTGDSASTSACSPTRTTAAT